jgi:hypothetical protein
MESSQIQKTVESYSSGANQTESSQQLALFRWRLLFAIALCFGFLVGATASATNPTTKG